ncbi:hypothetical protein EDB80DRAFT_712748 [Ilyonectria destructans]|nr:hypothetical protein EDB80DRAFT_712748 [Ilyonectria destructans]
MRRVLLLLALAPNPFPGLFTSGAAPGHLLSSSASQRQNGRKGLLSSGHASTLTRLVFILSDAPVFSDWLVSARVKNIREHPYEVAWKVRRGCQLSFPWWRTNI